MTEMKKKGNSRSIFGLVGMEAISVIASSFMSSYFLLYLTDYAGIDVSFAWIGPLVLLIGRIVDFVNDPIQGIILDAAAPKRIGKYKLFGLISIVMLGISTAFAYSVPEIVKSNEVALFIWVLVFYLMYDFGTSWNTAVPMVQAAMADTVTRSRTMMIKRIFAIVLGMMFSVFMTVLNAVKQAFSLNNAQAFAVISIGYAAVFTALSLIAILLLKEDKSAALNERNQPKFKLKDVLDIFRSNKAVTINFFSQLFRGFVYAMMTATAVYYTKWAYCYDFTTNTLDDGLFGIISLINAGITMAPMMVAAILSPMFAKKLGSSIKLMNLSNIIVIISGGAMFAAQLVGLLRLSPVIFYILFAALAFGNGLSFVPTETLWMESMDYNEYKTGKTMGGFINVTKNFLGKLQAAVATAAVGALLVLIGYAVGTDGEYLGEVAQLPRMFTWFIIICALIPAVCAAISTVIYRFYPIDAKVKAEMDAAKELKLRQGLGEQEAE